MFQQVRVPILGMVENMSYLLCPHCQERIDVFSHGGGRKTADQMNIPFLGELALDPAVRIGGDSGQPVTLGNNAPAFMQLAENVIKAAEEARGKKGPAIHIED
jgi:ATP-binding protein involved in chromosome partitioning